MIEVLILSCLAALLWHRLNGPQAAPPETSRVDPTTTPWRAVLRVGGRDETYEYPGARSEADVARLVLQAGVDPRAILAIVPPGSPLPVGKEKTRAKARV